MTTPVVEIRPILLTWTSVNHSLPSEPDAIAGRELLAAGIGNSVTAPPVVIRPILLPVFSVNQRLPSGPAAMPTEQLPAVGIVKSARKPAASATRSPASTPPVTPASDQLSGATLATK